MKKLTFLCAFLALSACSYIKNKPSTKYLSARHGPNLNVPAPLSRAGISKYYYLPRQTGKPGARVTPPAYSQAT